MGIESKMNEEMTEADRLQCMPSGERTDQDIPDQTPEVIENA